MPGRWGRSPGAQAPTHRHIEVDVSLANSHRGGVEAYRLHGDSPGKQEKDDEGGGHQAEEHRQGHGELPVGERTGPGVEEWRSLDTKAAWAGGVQTLFSLRKALLRAPTPTHTHSCTLSSPDAEDQPRLRGGPERVGAPD